MSSQERKRAVLARLAGTDPSPSSFLPSPSPSIPALLPTSAAERTHETLQALISSYLVHHGYAATAASFDAQVRSERTERAQGLIPGRPAPLVVDDAARAHGADGALASAAESSAVRADIRSAALAGRAEDVLALLEAYYPSALAEGAGTDPHGGILFRLRCHAFVEAVLALSRANRDPAGASSSSSSAAAASGAGDLDALLALGQALHGAYGADARPAVRDELQAVLGLVAYGDPEREASGRTLEVLSDKEREKVADEVNGAVLRASLSLFRPSPHSRTSRRLTLSRSPAGAANLPPVPALEALYRQACATVRLAGDLGAGAAAMVDVASEVTGGRLS